MPMNKAEKAEMEALRLRCALAWPPSPPKPVDLDVARAGAGVEWLRLWCFNEHTKVVSLGMTNGHLCSPTSYSDEQMANRYSGGSRISMSQGAGGPWFASEADALANLHYRIAVQCAEQLRDVEARIEVAR